jgi:hypothetical protein
LWRQVLPGNQWRNSAVIISGSIPKMGMWTVVRYWVASRDDAQAVAEEVSEAASAALDEFHLAMEALGDGVVSGEVT